MAQLYSPSKRRPHGRARGAEATWTRGRGFSPSAGPSRCLQVPGRPEAQREGPRPRRPAPARPEPAARGAPRRARSRAAAPGLPSGEARAARAGPGASARRPRPAGRASRPTPRAAGQGPSRPPRSPAFSILPDISGLRRRPRPPLIGPGPGRCGATGRRGRRLPRPWLARLRPAPAWRLRGPRPLRSASGAPARRGRPPAAAAPAAAAAAAAPRPASRPQRRRPPPPARAQPERHLPGSRSPPPAQRPLPARSRPAPPAGTQCPLPARSPRAGERGDPHPHPCPRVASAPGSAGCFTRSSALSAGQNLHTKAWDGPTRPSPQHPGLSNPCQPSLHSRAWD